MACAYTMPDLHLNSESVRGQLKEINVLVQAICQTAR